MVLLKLKKYLLNYKREYVWGIIVLMFSVGFGVLVPWLLKYPIDFLKVEGATLKFYGYIGLFLGVAFLSGLFRFFMRKILIGISRKIEYDLRNQLFSHLQKLSPSFYQRFRTGDIMARATNDINAIRNLLGPGIMYSMHTSFYGVFAIFMMFQIDVKLTLFALLPFPIVTFGVNRLVKHLYRISSRVQKLFSDISDQAQEGFSGIRVVKAYTREQNQIHRFNEVNQRYLRKNLTLALLRGGMIAGITFLGGIGLVIVLYFGGKDVIQQRITIGEFVSFNAYLTSLVWPMIALGWVINIYQMGSASLNRIYEYLHTEPDIADTSITDHSISHLDGDDLQLKNVYFKFNPDSDYVLRNINLSIESGQLVGIVGKTGSGKSSLIKLMTRLYEPQHGEIYINGYPIKKIPLSVVRKSIGLVPQDNFLFSDTIAENIAFGNGNYQFDDLQNVARSIEIANEIETFSDQYDTLLGERGVNVSGGQKQRISIARAIMHNPNILILDDSFSAVDTVTERKILRNLKDKYSDMTKIIVSHRVLSLQDADLIVVMDDGQIVEQGSHEELIKQGDLYTELYYKQLIQQELESIE